MAKATYIFARHTIRGHEMSDGIFFFFFRFVSTLTSIDVVNL